MPGKNLRPLAGKPLVAHSIRVALDNDEIDRVVISTDCQDIAQCAQRYGAEVPFIRDAALATDTAPEWLVWQDMIQHMIAADVKLEAIVVLPPTAPLRSQEDVSAAIELFRSKPCDGVISVTSANHNPCFNMVTECQDGSAQIAIPSSDRVTRRQDAPTFYDVTTVVYVMRPEFVMHSDNMFDGRLLMQHVPTDRAVDIDTHLDLLWAEFLLKQNGGKNE